jgi:hypothetical protein
LESVTFVPSANQHPSQFKVLQAILESNQSSLKRVSVVATGSIRSLANVGLSKFQNLKRLELQDLEDNEASFMLQLEAAPFKEISI